MDPPAIANTLWAVAELDLQADEATRATLYAVLEREAPRMVAVGVRMTRSALQRLQWPVSDTVRRALGMKQGGTTSAADA